MEALARIVEEGGQLPPLPDSEVGGGAAVPGWLAALHRRCCLPGSGSGCCCASACLPCVSCILPSERSCTVRCPGSLQPNYNNNSRCMQWLREPEPAGEFRARVQGSIAYCKTPLKASKHFRGPAPSAEQDPEAAAAAAAAAQHTASPQAVAAAVAYSRDCAEAAAYARGWEQAREWDRRWKAGEVGGVSSWLACALAGWVTVGGPAA